MDKNVHKMADMFVNELSYVREQLELHKKEWPKIASATQVNVRTLRRITSRETAYPRYDTVGKLALHFRTKEKRRR